jgi:hypothetical protein
VPNSLGPGSVVVGDFNGDGRLDLATVNQDNTVTVYPGKGDGTFAIPSSYPVGQAPADIVAGDFNGDGRLDLATVNAKSNDVSVLLNVKGGFSSPDDLAISPRNLPLVADLDGDGIDDVTVINAVGDILFRKGRAQDAFATGAAINYDAPVTINPGAPSRGITTVRTSLGRLLVSVDATDNALSLFDFQDGVFARVGSLATGTLPAQVVAADFDGNGDDDLW